MCRLSTVISLYLIHQPGLSRCTHTCTHRTVVIASFLRTKGGRSLGIALYIVWNTFRRHDSLLWKNTCSAMTQCVIMTYRTWQRVLLNNMVMQWANYTIYSFCISCMCCAWILLCMQRYITWICRSPHIACMQHKHHFENNCIHFGSDSEQIGLLY